MSQGLERVLAASGQPALAELRQALGQAFEDAEASVARVEEHPLKSRVYRLRFHARGLTRTVVAKRLETPVASRCERLARCWLPAVGLGSAAPRLIAVSEPAGRWVWHVYEDLGEESLERLPEGDRVEAALRLIAQLHMRFVAHALLAECRAFTDDLGIDYFTTNVRDALHALEALSGHPEIRTPEHAALRDRMHARLIRLLEQTPVRARFLADSGAAETLLHGDLWTSNVFVTRTTQGLEARLLDWDRAGVGPASYDISTFLLRFPRERRRGILEHYDRAVLAEGGRPLDRAPLAMNFETAELSRYANRLIWPARAIAEGNTAWGFKELAEVEGWFDALEPVLDPVEMARPVARRHRRQTPGPELRPGTKLLIVNADDFGATPGVNRGILEAHERGIVTSTSLMVEASAASEAAEAGREAPELGIGLHVDLGRTPPADVAGIRRLLSRQAERFVELMGRKPTHLDSHRNSHLDPLALPEFLELAKAWEIPLRGHSRVRLLPSFYGQWNGESHPEQVGVATLLQLLATRLEPGITELICHPAYVDPTLDSSYRLEREVELATLCDPAIRQALATHDIQLAGFVDVSRFLTG
jgi:predicted glycoside hydrolase/deacetylase ChbG (UPF0249 family)/aminoglycoside/choline kinase family phosphotransferase